MGTTSISGAIIANNTSHTGKGGTIETSGHYLSIAGTVDAGQGGSWLLDPYDLTVDATAASTIDSSLGTGTNVTLQTTANSASGSGMQNASGNGDVIIASPLSWSTSATLTLNAYRNIDINAFTINQLHLCDQGLRYDDSQPTAPATHLDSCLHWLPHIVITTRKRALPLIMPTS